jgi:RNA 3'-terminal phosphate cyclase (ATP)
MIEIDGSHQEGGGQIVRSAIALSAITGKGVHIRNIRAGRERPGLRQQHLEGIRAAAAMCGADISGLKKGATEIEFLPHAITGGDHVVDIRTAGSVTLVLQTLVPIALHAKERTRVLIRGGTAVPFSPTITYFEHVLCRFLKNMGADIVVTTARHGFYPAGGGEIHAAILPGSVRPVEIIERGPLENIRAMSIAHTDLRNARVAQRMIEGFKHILPGVEAEYRYVDAHSTGCFISSQAHFKNSSLGADALGRPGKRAEHVGRDAALTLKRAMTRDPVMDSWMVDQIIPYMALAACTRDARSKVKIPGLSEHAETNMWVIREFLPVRFHEEQNILECFTDG